MLREIHETPAAVQRLLDGGVASARRAAEAIVATDPQALIIAARGSSDHAAIYAKYLVETCLGIPVALASTSVTTVYGAELRLRRIPVLAISQSGRSPDILGFLTGAGRSGAVTVAVVNDASSPLAAAAEHVLPYAAGAEKSVPATKTYVASLAAVALLVGQLAEVIGVADPFRGALGALPGHLEGSITRAQAWLPGASVVAQLRDADRCFVTSRGFNLATALEIALKLKETSGIFADGYSAADLLHGPVTVAGPGVPAIAFRPDGPMGGSIDRSIDALREAGSPVTVVGGREAAERHHEALVVAPELPESLTPLAYAVVGHLLAESVAQARGLDPDLPIGLRKVTETE